MAKNIEDALIEEFVENEFLLFPENAARIDKRSLDALEGSYKYDMSKNSKILGDITFKEYLDKVNPELLRQRSFSDKVIEPNYLGPVSDKTNGVSLLAAPLKSAAKQFGESYTRLITSAKRAHDTFSKFERNFEDNKLEVSSSLKQQMLPRSSK